MSKYWIISIVLVLFACKKSEDRRCIKGAGEVVTIERELTPFFALDLGPHIQYVLVQDTVEKVVLTGGENLLNFITTEVDGGVLNLRNTNRCNFLRSYKKVVVAEIHLKEISNVLFQGTKELRCENQLNAQSLTFVMKNGAGQCNLDVNSDILFLAAIQGFGNFTCKGSTNYLRVDMRDNGFGDAYELEVSDSLNVVSYSSEILKVNANGAQFRAEVGSNGDIWYKGSPTFLEYNQYGTGDLLDKN